MKLHCYSYDTILYMNELHPKQVYKKKMEDSPSSINFLEIKQNNLSLQIISIQDHYRHDNAISLNSNLTHPSQ